VRLDAAPANLARPSSLRPAAAVAIGGVAPVDADPEGDAPASPPPSIDGKGTRINTYA